MESNQEFLPELTPYEREVYEWQMRIKDFGIRGQRRLKAASVLISRVGGIGGLVAYQLAAAGVGRLVLAHAGNVKPSDLNRQLLMTADWVGKPRIESICRRLKELNPRIEIVGIPENISPLNAQRCVSEAEVVVDCAPLFAERFALNEECVKQRKTLIECSMYEMEGQLTTISPGKTPCLKCLVPHEPPTWKRQFPVLGAVSGAVACLAATEVVKRLVGFGELLEGRMLHFDLRTSHFRALRVQRLANCPVCSHL